MGTDDDGVPSVGSQNGETVAVFGSDTGTIHYEEPADVDEMLKAVGMTKEEMKQPLGELGGEIEASKLADAQETDSDTDANDTLADLRTRLPAHATLTDDGVLWVATPDGDHNRARWDQTRRAVLRKMDEGADIDEVADMLNVSAADAAEISSVFGFLLDDAVLRREFVVNGSKFAPSYDPQATHEASAEPESDPATPESPDTDEADEADAEPAADHVEAEDTDGDEEEEEEEEEVAMVEDAIRDAYERGRADAEVEARDSAEADLFDGDEWWEIMQVLLENDCEEYARRIASERDFN